MIKSFIHYEYRSSVSKFSNSCIKITWFLSFIGKQCMLWKLVPIGVIVNTMVSHLQKSKVQYAQKQVANVSWCNIYFILLILYDNIMQWAHWWLIKVSHMASIVINCYTYWSTSNSWLNLNNSKNYLQIFWGKMFGLILSRKVRINTCPKKLCYWDTGVFTFFRFFQYTSYFFMMGDVNLTNSFLLTVYTKEFI